MNKKIAYILLLCLFLAGSAFIILRYERKHSSDANKLYYLLDRKGALAQAADWNNTKLKVRSLYLAIADNPKDTKSQLELATIFIQEARISGNYSYYDIAAMRQINNILNTDPQNFQALTLKALILLSQHHFADGLAAANTAQAINPFNSFIYGMLVDANVEMGYYKDAISAADKMVSLRPDLRSYSRISYIREIYGDYPGAIAAMTLALDAGIPGDDGTEWVRVQLGNLFENTGKIDSAQYEYAQSLSFRNGFAPAIAGLGHIAFIKKDYNKAIQLYSQADTLAMNYTYKENLAEIYKITGNKTKADSLSSLVINQMSNDASAAVSDENIGHYVDRELAYAYLSAGENDKALDHALAEYNRRPDNIDVNQTVAWVYYKMKDYNKALPYIKVALKTNSKNPTLLCNAGLIYAGANQHDLAKTTLQEALKNDPGIDPELKAESENVLKTL